jgi:hypothetical protein
MGWKTLAGRLIRGEEMLGLRNRRRIWTVVEEDLPKYT